MNNCNHDWVDIPKTKELIYKVLREEFGKRNVTVVGGDIANIGLPLFYTIKINDLYISYVGDRFISNPARVCLKCHKVDDRSRKEKEEIINTIKKDAEKRNNNEKRLERATKIYDMWNGWTNG